MSMSAWTAVLAASLAAIPWALSWTAARAEAPRVARPLTHGNLTVFLLRGPSTPGPVPLTLAEALEKGSVVVNETGNVRELKIENTGSEPVFIQLGDIVKGGRQDRVLTVSLLLQPHSGLVPVGAYCVERGRWSARDKEDAHRFAQSDALMPSREAKVAIARPSGLAAAPPADPRTPPISAELDAYRERATAAEARRTSPTAEIEQRIVSGLPRGLRDSQGDIWRNVDQLQQRLSESLAAPVVSERSATSLQLSLESARLKEALAAYVSALEPAGVAESDVVGVAFAVGGRLASAELYPSSGLFRKMWPKLVRAAATEAIALREPASGPPPTEAAVQDFLAAAESGTRSERKLGGLASIETRETEKVLSVEASAPKGGLVHRSYLAK